MHFSVIFTIVIAYLSLPTEGDKHLPKNWGTCHKKDADFLPCLKKNLEIAIKDLKHDIPEFGLKSQDPLEIPELSIGAGKGPVNVAQNFKNVKIHGVSNIKVEDVKIDWNTNTLYSKTLSPELRLEADYNMKGKVLLLPIVGDGPCNITLINVRIEGTLLGELFDKKGKQYMRFKDFKLKLYPEKVIFKFDNLFNGDKTLGDNINNVLNDNNLEVFADVRDGYETAFSQILKSTANQVMPSMPVNEIFLD